MRAYFKNLRPGTIAGLTPVLFMLGSTPAAGQAPGKAVIISTSSINGETVSCGCKKKDLGGIARRSTVVKEARSQNKSVLLVDAGDFGSHVVFKPWMRTEFQWKMMKELGYDVVTPGPNEMTHGLLALKNLYNTAPAIQVVSANVTDREENPVWLDHALIEKGGVVYGVTGVTDKAYYSFNLSKGVQLKDDFKFGDLKGSLERVLPLLREKADIVVLLLHTGPADARRLLEDIEGVDVAVIGHTPGYKFIPERINNTLLIRAGERGQYVSVLELALDENKSIADYNGESRPMGDTIIQDETFLSTITVFNKKYDDMRAADQPEKVAAEKSQAEAEVD